MTPTTRLMTVAVGAGLLGAARADAQATYWLPTVQKTPAGANYTYNVKVPDYLLPWLLEQTPIGGGKTEQKTIGGKSYTFVKQYFTWDTNGSSPARTGQIRLDNNRERWKSNIWKSSEALKQDRAVIAALDSAAKPSPNAWREVDLLILKWDGPNPGGLRLSDEALAGGKGYWLANVQRTPTTITYTFNVKAPESLTPFILEQTPLGGGGIVQKAIGGQSHSFVRQYVTWDSNGSAPSRTGQLRVDNNRDRSKSNAWKSSPDLQTSAVAAALESAAKPGTGPWKEADLLVLKWDADDPPRGLRLTEEIPPVDQAKATMVRLTGQTRPGAFYPDSTKAPGDLQAFRTAMLKVGNAGRSDPKFRQYNRYASDFGGATVRTDAGTEKIFKTSPTPPYFAPLTLDPKLNEACQFQAEYQAHTLKQGHDGPANYKNINLSTLGLRVKHFTGDGGKFGAAEGAGCDPEATAFPEGWMKNESHYRPWFNISGEVKAVGLGAAQGRNGAWCFCMAYKPETPAK